MPKLGDVLNSWYMSQNSALVRVVTSGNYLRLFIVNGVRVVPLQVGKRSRGDRRSIVEFTPPSRWRFLERLNSMNFDNAVFLSLTFHDPVDREFAKRALKRIVDKLRRMRTWGAWKMEFQKRGVVHFHLISCSEESLNYDWLPEYWHYWAKRQGWGVDWAALLHAADWEFVSGDRVAFYVAKYMLKDGGGGREFGRYWGFWGRRDAFYKKKELFLPGPVLRSILRRLGDEWECSMQVRRSGLVRVSVFCGDVLGGGADSLFEGLTGWDYWGKMNMARDGANLIFLDGG